VNYLKDLRYSVRESIIRSIEKGEFVLARKLPKSESLKNCMDRTIPYFKERIVPDAVDQGKRVLISSSENAIRGLLMHLCEIPEEHITGLEIPNGLPLIFDMKSKCVKVRFAQDREEFCMSRDLTHLPCASHDYHHSSWTMELAGIHWKFITLGHQLSIYSGLVRMKMEVLMR
jgi:hypothetical protein